MKIKITSTIVFAIILNFNILFLWAIDAIGFWDLLNMGVHGVARGKNKSFPYVILFCIVMLAYLSISKRALEKINWYERSIFGCAIILMFLMWISRFLTETEALIVHFGGGAVVSFISLFIVYKEMCNRSSDSKR